MFKNILKNILGDENKDQSPVSNQSESDDAQDNHELHETEYDPETLHGTHYTEEDFDAEVERRVTYELARRDMQDAPQSEKDNFRFNLRRDVYKEWTGADSDQMIRWEHANSMKHTGIATSGFVKEDASNPYLEPIHGISLRDYAAIATKLTSGVPEDAIFKAMGIDKAVWEEVNTLWPKRMQQDSSFTVVTLYGQYFMEGATHPKLEALQADTSDEGKSNLEKIRTDQYFYEELCGARQAAYEYGLDGAQWILDNYGITLRDFQAVAMEHMTARNQNWNSDEITHFHNYQQEKQKEYAARFAAEQGGNVADDVEF